MKLSAKPLLAIAAGFWSYVIPHFRPLPSVSRPHPFIGMQSTAETVPRATITNPSKLTYFLHHVISRVIHDSASARRARAACIT